MLDVAIRFSFLLKSPLYSTTYHTILYQNSGFLVASEIRINRQFHHGTHGSPHSGGTEAVGERDLRDPSTAPSNMRLRNLPCPSVYSVVKKAPPRPQFHHGTHGNARSGGTEAVGERDLRDPSTAPSNMRLRNLPCASVYSVVIKAPPRRQFHHGTHGNAHSGGTEAVGEKGLRDSLTSNMPLINATDLSSFRRRPLIGPSMAMNSQRRKLQIGRVGCLRIVLKPSVRFRVFVVEKSHPSLPARHTIQETATWPI